ncbi:TRAP transporter permease [Geomicrobium sediminis]|uniref:TRAP transporter 4TM/12TM fusion protein n=1 Tax=Geomicrobium sediminis TaxID=1347788 RepID=A0ABS2PH42_9BACL|nr:TRAP transporter permease [Geomicrobium sediminis]MBM7634587.1 TRAP transporter 4TM/12TM fusion protein [Geomicrobium sediminis]
MAVNDATEVKEKDVEQDQAMMGRQLKGWQYKTMAVIAILLSGFAIYVNSLMNIQEIYRNIIFLALLLILAFLLYPARKKGNMKRFTKIDLALAIISIIGTGYILIFYTTIHIDRVSQAIPIDYVFAIITVLLLLEASRRTLGTFIPILAGAAMIYAVFGPYFPGMFGHAGFSIERLLYRVYMTTEGVFGLTLSIASTYIVIFILFGAFLSVSGASKLFNDLAIAVAGQRRGGPAQVAVISSALTGSLNGSAVANVATTGAFTIPLMKQVGLKRNYAAAVEATASTGGMMMPPIMGAAAFIMAGFLGVPYATVVFAAIIPTFLYFIALVFAIDLEAKKQGLKGMSKDSIPQVWTVLKERGVLLFPILIVIGTLLAGYTPLFAGFAGIISVIVASWLTKDKETRVNISKVKEAFIGGAKSSVQVGLACASIGIIIAVVTMSGLGSAIAYNVLNVANGMLWIALLLVMVTCIVLSMGLPSTALYIVVAVTAAPALIEMGINPIAAHFFVFWFGALSNITPPVALASYTAAGIAGADAMKTSWTSVKLALPGFIIPFMIAYNPVMVLQETSTHSVNALTVTTTVVTCVIGVFAMAVALSGYLSTDLQLIEKITFFVGAILLIAPGMMTNVIGFILIGLTMAWHMMRSKREAAVNMTS